MTVREGVPADLPALREIQAALVEPWPELLETAVAGPLSLYVLEDGGPVAYAVAFGGTGGVAYVPEFAVHPAEQGQGYGSRLLSAVCERLEAAGHTEIRLTVSASDRRARAFYAEHGFERLDRLVEHFESGDGLLLGLDLEGT